MNKILKIFKESKIEIIDESILIEYINFCTKNNEQKHTTHKTARHHILPQCKFLPFALYSDLNINYWNGVYLTHDNHYIAHSMLHDAINNFYIGSAWHHMSNINKFTTNGVDLISRDEYKRLQEKANMQNSIRMSKWCKEVDENGITNIQKSHIKRVESGYNDIDENGLNAHQRIAIKSASTMKEKDENGMSIYEKSFIKAKKTMKENNHSKGNKNPRAKRINIYNYKNELMFECNGNIVETIKKHNLPGVLIKSYKAGGLPIFQTRKSKLLANKYNNLMFIGWFAKEV
jgi:hypothetical protein